MEQRNQALRADVAGRFLSDLRALRTAAGLDHGQLAARAHYPRDVISAAEAGPYLPALPVLAAYVRGCGGTGDEILAWEDRWRAVTGSKAHPLLSARVAGLSGANRPLSRESSDPEAIRSALQRFGNRMSQPGPSPDAPREEPREPAAQAAAPAAAPAAPAASVSPPTPVDPGTPVTPVRPAASAAPAAPPPARAPAAPPAPAAPAAEPPRPAETRSGPKRDGGMSARTATVAAIVAALVILLIVILAL